MQTDIPSLGEAARPVAASRRSARTQYNRVMKLVRRIHLYTGLFMTPWVFLYGVTGYLFNHPDSFSDQEVRAFGASEVAGTPLGEVPRASELAARVVDHLNATEAKKSPGKTPYRLIRPEEARYTRDLFAAAHGPRKGEEYFVRIDLENQTGSIRTAVESAVKPAPFFRPNGVKLSPPPFEPVLRSVPTIMKNSGIEGREPTLRSTPDVSFVMEGESKTWRVFYNTQLGRVSGRVDQAPAPMSVRRFLILLHVAHGFPASFESRWVWAVVVDLMFVAMVGWGISGLLMWWQMKNVRRVGAVILCASAVVATALALGMHHAFTM